MVCVKVRLGMSATQLSWDTTVKLLGLRVGFPIVSSHICSLFPPYGVPSRYRYYTQVNWSPTLLENQPYVEMSPWAKTWEKTWEGAGGGAKRGQNLENLYTRVAFER